MCSTFMGLFMQVKAHSIWQVLLISRPRLLAVFHFWNSKGYEAGCFNLKGMGQTWATSFLFSHTAYIFPSFLLGHGHYTAPSHAWWWNTHLSDPLRKNRLPAVYFRLCKMIRDVSHSKYYNSKRNNLSTLPSFNSFSLSTVYAVFNQF